MLGQVFYDFSGGMESAAMLVIEKGRIFEKNACVRFADTGKQFPEMDDSIRQIQAILGINIVRIRPRITFDEFLFDRGGMLRKGMNDCSRRMKRANLMAHMKTFDPPYEVNLGYNAAEYDRADDWSKRNERSFCHWRFPLQDARPPITREMTWKICEDVGFTVLLHMYRKMGRFDCFWCPNQTNAQAAKVASYYPVLAQEWNEAEVRKGHSFKQIPMAVFIESEKTGIPPRLLQAEHEGQPSLFKCSCFGGSDDVWDESC